MNAEERAALAWLAPPAPRIDEAAATRAFEHALATYHQGFDTFFLARLMGLSITYPESTCRVTMQPQDFMFNPQGALHGGLIATLLDIAMGHLLKQAVRPGVTLEMKVQYLRPIRQQRIECIARFLSQGRSIHYLEASIHDGDRQLAAVATSTWKLLPASPASQPEI